MKLYHGTSEEFEIPNIVMCKPMTDFGRGGIYLQKLNWQKIGESFHLIIMF